MAHSSIVGGSTAKRVINCPGSVALVQRMPPQVESKYAAEGTKLHEAMQRLLDTEDTLGVVADEMCLDDGQKEKLSFCLNALDQIDPKRQMTYVTEAKVEFEGVKALEGVFGSADVVGCIGDRCVVLDWKFGDGVIVEAEENPQGLFYAAAVKKTSHLYWAAQGTSEVEIIIVQPPMIRRWVTTWRHVDEFERELVEAVKLSAKPDAPLAIGDHCRWCTAKPICPQMNGSIDRVVHTALKDIDGATLGEVLRRAEALESFINDARTLAQARLEKGMPVPGYKLVPKRAVRQWANEENAAASLALLGEDAYKRELLSPAQAEKVCKKQGVAFPAHQVVAVSSGNTIAPESDPRPSVAVIGEQLKAALSRVQ